MRISDWSSDVCSSDLEHDAENRQPKVAVFRPQQPAGAARRRGGGRGLPRAVRGGGMSGDHMSGGGPDPAHLERLDRVVADYLASDDPVPQGATHEIGDGDFRAIGAGRSEEHTAELKSLMRNSYAVFCLKT